jgi:hypothetical protein
VESNLLPFILWLAVIGQIRVIGILRVHLRKIEWMLAFRAVTFASLAVDNTFDAC